MHLGEPELMVASCVCRSPTRNDELLSGATFAEDGGDTDREDEIGRLVLIVGDGNSFVGASKWAWGGQLESGGRGAVGVAAGGARRRPLVMSTATFQGSLIGPRRSTCAAIAWPTAPTTATSGGPAKVKGSVVGSRSSVRRVAVDQISWAFAWARRSQPRTVVAGRLSWWATRRCPSPVRAACRAAPTVAASRRTVRGLPSPTGRAIRRSSSGGSGARRR